jgi:hypothetical protein
VRPENEKNGVNENKSGREASFWLWWRILVWTAAGDGIWMRKMDAEKHHHHPKWEGEEPLLLTALLLGAGLESSLEYGFEKGRTMDAFFLML